MATADAITAPDPADTVEASIEVRLSVASLRCDDLFGMMTPLR